MAGHHTPRLLRLVKWVGLLSEGEAESAIQGYREKFDYVCEAVAHYGGAWKLIERAVSMRHQWLSMLQQDWVAHGECRQVKRITLPNYWRGVHTLHNRVWWSCRHKHPSRMLALRCSYRNKFYPTTTFLGED